MLLLGLCGKTNDRMTAAVRLPGENVACKEHSNGVCLGTVFCLYRSL